MCGFTSLSFIAEEAKKPYVIQRKDEMLVVTDMPKSTVSVPIVNSFVYIDGEYIEPPYIVSVSNLTVCINGHIVRNFEPLVQKQEWYVGRVGITPENVGKAVAREYEFYVERLDYGTVSHIVHGGMRVGSATFGGDGGALAIIEKARKAIKGDEQIKQEFAKEMGLDRHLSNLRPDWIQRLANNTALETRATKILEAKRERERLEKEKREQQNR
jgi:hypothetical protein